MEPIIQTETIEVPVEIIKEVPVPGPERIIEREIIVEVPVQEIEGPQFFTPTRCRRLRLLS